MDRRAAAALDRYLTRSPYDDCDEPVQPKCCVCGVFLPAEPSYKVEADAVRHCDGQPLVFEEEQQDDAVLAIIGEEHRGEKYTLAYAPACGTKEGGPGNCGGDQSEIHPDEADEWKHEPHTFPDPWGSGTTLVWICSRGHKTEEPLH